MANIIESGFLFPRHWDSYSEILAFLLCSGQERVRKELRVTDSCQFGQGIEASICQFFDQKTV